MTFLDNVGELILITIIGGVLTTIFFGVVTIYAGVMMSDGKEGTESATSFAITMFVLFLITNIILFIVSINQIFFN